MKKQEVLNLINNLDGFLNNIKSINEHPYSKGIDVDRLIADLQNYLKDMANVIEQIEELEPDKNEPEEISE
jgi:hypothetical protein